MRVHKREIVSPWFEDLKSGKKKFELRKEKHKGEFWVGDNLCLMHKETREKITCRITYLYDGKMGVQENWVILGIEVVNG